MLCIFFRRVQPTHARVGSLRSLRYLRRRCSHFESFKCTEKEGSGCTSPLQYRGDTCACTSAQTCTPSVYACTVKLGPERPPGPGQSLCHWPLQALHGKGRGKFQTLRPLASRSRARAGVRAPPRTPRNPAILLHSLKEFPRHMFLNALVKSIFRCTLVEKRVENIAGSSSHLCPQAPHG